MKAAQSEPTAAATGIEQNIDSVDDPHDSWDADAFKATLGENKEDKPINLAPEAKAAETSEPATASTEIEAKDEPEWKEGAVFSIKSQKELHGAAKQAVLNKGSWDHFEEPEGSKADANTTDPKISNPDISNVDLSKFQTGGAATGQFLGEFAAGKDAKSAELTPGFSEQEIAKMSDREKANPVSDAATFDKQLSHDVQNALDKEFPGAPAGPKGVEQPKTSEQAAFEKTRARWREWKEKSETHDKKYNELLREHILKESKGWRYFANMPRRMFGLQPKLSQELEDMRGESQGLRWAYNDAVKELRKAKKDFIKPRMRTTGITQTPEEYNNSDKVLARHQRMFAYHVTTGTHKKRLEAQRGAVNEAWGESKVLRPVSEALAKHKKLIVPPMLLGATILNPFGVFAGLGAGLGVKKLLDKAYVESARKRLADQQANIGENYFDKYFLEEDREMEKATALVGAREARAKTIATAAGIAAGMTAAGYVNSLGTETVNNPPPSGGETVPPGAPPSGPAEIMPEPPNHADVTPPGVETEPPLEDAGPDHEPEETPEDHEDETDQDNEVGPVRVHTVERGDNVWNILEGKGPDNNPIGGKSEVLQDMSLSERRHWLDKLVEYYEQNPQEAKELGAVKSDGVIHKIYPGEEINVTKLDEKLLELMHQNNAGEVPTPTARPEVGEVVLPDSAPTPEVRPATFPSEAPIPESRPEVLSSDAALSPETQNPSSVPEALSSPRVTNINDMSLDEFSRLTADVALMEPSATARLAELGMDVDTFMDMSKSLVVRDGNVSYDPNMTIGEALNQTERMPGTSPSDIPAATPFDGRLPQDGEVVVRDASFNPESAVNTDPAALQNYVQEIEKGKSSLLWGGRPDVAGTFDVLKNMSFADIKAVATSPDLGAELERLGIQPEGWNRWVDTINEQAKLIPANDNEQLGQYIARVVSGNRAA